LLTLSFLNVTCNKYFVVEEYDTQIEWIFTVRSSVDWNGPNSYCDTIWPAEGLNGIKSAELHISELSSDNEEFFVHFYLNDHLAAIQRFDRYRDEGVLSLGSYTQYYDLYSDNEIFHYEMIYDDEYYRLFRTKTFPIPTGPYYQSGDTITTNYFRIKN
jgi:hypothetical protein